VYYPVRAGDAFRLKPIPSPRRGNDAAPPCWNWPGFCPAFFSADAKNLWRSLAGRAVKPDVSGKGRSARMENWMRLATAAFATLVLTAAPALAEDLVFTLVNNSSLNLVELYVSPQSADEWGENILTVAALAAGDEGNVTIADGLDTCDYDLRFVMDSGATAEGSQDLCKLETFTLND
jgi:hypothetical protein